MRILFCGVRGSTAAPGAEFVRVGGHTSCVAVTPIGADRPRLLLDAGTGIRAVTPLLGGEAFHGTILLTHLHWDHVQGLPFFVAGDRVGAVVRLLLPAIGESAAAALGRAMSPPHFPIGPDGLRGDWTFDAVHEGVLTLEGIEVTARVIPHKGGLTFGYRLTDSSGSMAYLPDHLPAASGDDRDAALALIDGVDLLVHGGQFVAAEEAMAAAFGHSTVEGAVALAVEGGVGRLILSHHAPTRVDDDVDAIEASVADRTLTVGAARQGDEWDSERDVVGDAGVRRLSGAGE